MDGLTDWISFALKTKQNARQNTQTEPGEGQEVSHKKKTKKKHSILSCMKYENVKSPQAIGAWLPPAS